MVRKVRISWQDQKLEWRVTLKIIIWSWALKMKSTWYSLRQAIFTARSLTVSTYQGQEEVVSWWEAFQDLLIAVDHKYSRDFQRFIPPRIQRVTRGRLKISGVPRSRKLWLLLCLERRSMVALRKEKTKRTFLRSEEKLVIMLLLNRANTWLESYRILSRWNLMRVQALIFRVRVFLQQPTRRLLWKLRSSHSTQDR